MRGDERIVVSIFLAKSSFLIFRGTKETQFLKQLLTPLIKSILALQDIQLKVDLFEVIRSLTYAMNYLYCLSRIRISAHPIILTKVSIHLLNRIRMVELARIF